jgi:hypothetical protein
MTTYCPARKALSELQPQFGPGATWGAGRKERHALQRIVSCLVASGVGSKGPGQEITRAGQSCVRQLRSGVVVTIEQIIDLEGKHEVFGQVVMGSQIRDGIAR